MAPELQRAPSATQCSQPEPTTLSPLQMEPQEEKKSPFKWLGSLVQRVPSNLITTLLLPPSCLFAFPLPLTAIPYGALLFGADGCLPPLSRLQLSLCRYCKNRQHRLRAQRYMDRASPYESHRPRPRWYLEFVLANGVACADRHLVRSRFLSSGGKSYRVCHRTRGWCSY